MRKLFSLIVAAGLSLSQVSSQDIKFPHETDRNKFIPNGAIVTDVFADTRYYGMMNMIWYNRDCKSQGDYYEKLRERGFDIPRNELFLDLDVPGDGIPDLSLEGLDEFIENYQQSQALARSAL